MEKEEKELKKCSLRKDLLKSLFRDKFSVLLCGRDQRSF